MTRRPPAQNGPQNGNPDGNQNGGPRLPAEPIVPTVAVPRPQSVSPEQAVALAAQQRMQGNLTQAENLLKQVLQVQPENHAAWHELALVAHGAGRIDLAAQLLENAVKFSKGKLASYHANLGELYRMLKNLDKAVAHGRKAVELAPSLAYARSNLGIAYYDLEDYDKAETCHKLVLKAEPAHPQSLNNMGSIYRDRDDDDEKALEWYAKATEADPSYLEPVNNMGATLLRLERHDEAMAALDRALAVNPRYAEAICNKGYIFAALERYEQALACYNASLQIRPEYPEACIGLANIYREKILLDKAEEAARRAIEFDPDGQEAWCTLGAVQMAQGRSDLAEQSYNKALELDPESSGAKRGIGHIRLENGDLAEAEEIFSSTIDEGRERIASLFSLAQARKTKRGDAIIAQLEKEAENEDGLSDNKKIFLNFGLGKIYDDIGENDKAFPRFIEGCRLKRTRLPYDAQVKDAHFRKIRDLFTPEFMEKHKGHGFESETPVFVVGMPRSGTTLTEQIIASHPKAFGAGEIFDFLDLAGSNNKDGSAGFPDTTAGLKDGQIRDIGRRYVEGLQQRAPKSARVTDKMPINFQHIGLIRLALPQAKIVHVSRHPLDTCISCFTRLFAHNQNCTYDLAELGLFYKGYHETMRHWREVLPEGSFYDIRYEELVADTETEARKLIDYCGLDWNDACLEFYKHERSIRTASVTQVRQPIYKTSLARWKKYEKFLGPLIEALGDVMPDGPDNY